jgi:hypothetical protein
MGEGEELRYIKGNTLKHNDTNNIFVICQFFQRTNFLQQDWFSSLLLVA